MSHKKGTGVRRVAWMLLLVLAAVSIWAAFRFVITDAQLFLGYLRVLVWPTLVLVVLSLFRVPVEEKVRQLLRLDAFGASAEFSAEAQGRRLDRDLQGDLANLLERMESPDDEGNAGNEHSTDGGDSSVVGQEEPSQDSRDPTPEPPQKDAGDAVDMDDEQATVTEKVEVNDVDTSHRAWLEVARALGMATALLAKYEKRLAIEPEQAEASLKNDVIAEVTRAKAMRNQAAHRQEDTRESLEAVIRKSAAWGYDMGRAGAPEAVPDIEWNADGSWRIVTEVPKEKPKPKVAPRNTSSGSTALMRETRQIKALEDEIKDIERKRHTKFGSLGTIGMLASGFEEDGWLRELKRRLAAVDPGNPWTL